MDDQDQNPAMAGDQFLDPPGHHRQDPGRLARNLLDAIAIQRVAIHPRVDQRMGMQAARKFAGDFRGVKVVDPRMKPGARRLAGASTVGRDQQYRCASLDHLQPTGAGGE